jgi:hypothetical protein
MVDHAASLGATRTASALLVLFIPSMDRFEKPIDQDFWVEEALGMLGRLFRGGTAFPQGRGVWRDDARGGILLYDQPVVIQCYTSEELLETQGEVLRAFLIRLGTEAKQGAVGLVIDRDYLEIGFDLLEETS